MSQINKGETFTDVSPGKIITSTRLNNHVDGATLLNGAVLDQLEKTVTVADDCVLLGDSALASSGVPKKVKLTNLLPETIRQGVPQYVATDTGAANAYVVALNPAATAYTAGMVVRFKAGNANTTAATINVNSLGVKTIKTPAGGDLAANDILAGQVVTLVYDGTYFQHTTAVSADAIVASKLAEATRNSSGQYAADTGAADAYVIAPSPAFTAYAAGMVVRFKAGNTNTTASTVNVNSLGTKTIKKVVAGAMVDISAKDIQANDLVTLVYDGTYFHLAGRVRSWDFVSAETSIPLYNAASAAVAHGLGALPTKVRVVLVAQASSASYAQHDEVEVCHFTNSSSANIPFITVCSDATNVTCSRDNTNATTMGVTPKGGNAARASVNVSDWKLKIYASL